MSDELVDLVVARLRETVTDLYSVAGAVDFAELVERGQRPQRLPAAFVLPLAEDAAENELLGTDDWLQMVTETIAVVIVHQDRGDASGDKARRRTAPIVRQAQQALIGWSPDLATIGPLHYRRTRLHGLTAGAVWQQVDFTSRRELVREG